MRARPARRRWIIAPILLAALLPQACGGDDEGGAQDPADLEGDPWVLTQFINAAGDTEIVDVGVNAEFDGSTMSGVSGCNRYNASYEANGNEISFGPIAGTKMACPEPEMSVETRYLELLATVATFEVDGRSMSMSDGDGTPILQFARG
ncbi:MAG: META domain-containing protein [Actinobacteria bacterium]|nr:META domain-containing protein [Actinomycetota bacterium]